MCYYVNIKFLEVDRNRRDVHLFMDSFFWGGGFEVIFSLMSVIVIGMFLVVAVKGIGKWLSLIHIFSFIYSTPAGVNLMVGRCRSNSFTPNSSSNLLMEAVRAGWEIKSLAAAFVIFCSSAIAIT